MCTQEASALQIAPNYQLKACREESKLLKTASNLHWSVVWCTLLSGRESRFRFRFRKKQRSKNESQRQCNFLRLYPGSLSPPDCTKLPIKGLQSREQACQHQLATFNGQLHGVLLSPGNKNSGPGSSSAPKCTKLLIKGSHSGISA